MIDLIFEIADYIVGLFSFCVISWVLYKQIVKLPENNEGIK